MGGAGGQEGHEDVVDFDSDLTAAMGDFQAFLYVRPDL